MKVISWNGSHETDCFINTIANGRRFAGGFFLTPKAIANDGLLDVCMIRRLSLRKDSQFCLKVPKGKHINDKRVNYYQTGSINLEFPEKVPFHVDGELYFSSKFEVGIIPRALKIIYNPDGNHFFAENNNTGNYIAFFDLDQTLTRSISGKALAIAGFRKGLFTTRDLFKAVFLTLAYRFKLRNPSRIIDEMVSWVKGIPENKMDDLCSEVFRNVILPSVYKEAITEIEFHKAKNARVVILSSALKTICSEMAENLALDDFICSELEVRNGVSDRLTRRAGFASEKRKQSDCLRIVKIIISHLQMHGIMAIQFRICQH